MIAKLFRWFFRMKGWTITAPIAPNIKKCVIIGAPHTSIALTAAQTRLADTQYDYKIAEVTLAYTSRGADLGDLLLVSRRSSTDASRQGPHRVEGPFAKTE